MVSHIILYVLNQGNSSRFYENVLCLKPALEVPGMTVFHLSGECKLGLMPYSGINKLFDVKITSPERASQNPNSEVYLMVDDPQEYHQRSLEHGATELSAVSARDWGHRVGYSRDIDGHILAFAKSC